MTDCVFCPENWGNLTITERCGESIAILVPLDPVVSGHRLVISEFHTADAAANPTTAAGLMHYAAAYVSRNKLQANIITSIGPAATQTVMHTHLHIVPRTEDDKLMLPWTLQQLRKKREAYIDEVTRTSYDYFAGRIDQQMIDEAFEQHVEDSPGLPAHDDDWPSRDGVR